MAIKKAKYYRFNGEEWDQFLFETSADLIIETQNYKVMTADERQKINTYLSTFNQPDKLVKLGAEGNIDANLIPNLSNKYLSVNGGTVNGAVTVNGNITAYDVNVSGKLYTDYLSSFTGTLDIAPNQERVDVYSDINMNGTRIKDLGDPTANGDAATKGYVDALVAVGTRPVESVVAATTGNINLSGEVTIDGYAVKEGDRVLVWKQSNKSQNGIYVVSSSSWTKVTEDSSQGAYVFVEHGNTHNDWYFFCQDQDGTWVAHGRPDTIKAGAGLTKTGTTLSISNGAITNNMLAGDIQESKIRAFGLNPDQYGWSYINYEGPAHLSNHLTNLYVLVRLIRGTERADTENNQTIKGAYEEATKRNRTYVGSSLPSNSGYQTGDLFFLELASS